MGAGGTRLYYCGFIGGAFADAAACVAVTPTGTAYVAGQTASTQASFPVKVGPDLTYNGFRNDAFVAKLEHLMLTGSGSTRRGGTVALLLEAPTDASLSFQLGSSYGTGPLWLGTRWVFLSPDSLLAVSVNGLWPSVFQGYRGVLDIRGQATAQINIPRLQALIGTRIHTAFITLDPAAPSGIRSISNTFSFSITK